MRGRAGRKFVIPASLAIPTCDVCGAEIIDDALVAALGRAEREPVYDLVGRVVHGVRTLNVNAGAGRVRTSTTPSPLRNAAAVLRA